MSRINTNVSSIIAQRILTDQNDRLNLSLQRLSTGLRINSGKDDPAGLIASETMRAEMRAIQAAESNIARATNVVSVAESGLRELSNLLNDMEELVDRTANTSGISDEERDANQQEIDAILDSINRIAASTELQGRKLLSGELAYDTTNVDTAAVSHLQVNSARLLETGPRSVVVDVTEAASFALVSYAGGAIAGAPVTIEVSGALGADQLTFDVGATTTEIASAVQDTSGMTGVSAIVSGGSLIFTSTGYGSEEFVKVRTLSGTFVVDAGGGSGNNYDYGNDAVATVNGQSATSNGLTLSVRNSILDAEITLTTAFGTDITATPTTFDITGGGAQFVISPEINLNSIASLGVQAVTTADLGNGDVGFLYSLGSGQANEMRNENFHSAQRILRLALNQINTLRARLGSFEKNTLETSLNSLQVQYENVAAAESLLRDTDFAEETSQLTRSQILVQSATNVLRIANQQPQQVLALLQ